MLPLPPSSTLFPYTTLFRSIGRMRQQRMTPAQIADKAADQGVSFQVTPATQKLLARQGFTPDQIRSEEHTSELQSHSDLVCRLLLEKKKRTTQPTSTNTTQT